MKLNHNGGKKMTKTFNVNELLDKKKYVEQQINEKLGVVSEAALTYSKETITDRDKPENNREIEAKKKVTIAEFSQTLNGMIDEVASIKTAVHKHNAEKVINLLQKRNATRTKIQFLDKIKQHLPRDTKSGRQVLSQTTEGVPVEIRSVVDEPMFEIDAVNKIYDELAATERKLNTDIQKLNLDAKITL